MSHLPIKITWHGASPRARLLFLLPKGSNNIRTPLHSLIFLILKMSSRFINNNALSNWLIKIIVFLTLVLVIIFFQVFFFFLFINFEQVLFCIIIMHEFSHNVSNIISTSCDRARTTDSFSITRSTIPCSFSRLVRRLSSPIRGTGSIVKAMSVALVFVETRRFSCRESFLRACRESHRPTNGRALLDWMQITVDGVVRQIESGRSDSGAAYGVRVVLLQIGAWLLLTCFFSLWISLFSNDRFKINGYQFLRSGRVYLWLVIFV